MHVSINQLMVNSGVAFGTSGARGLVSALTDRVVSAYTQGFLQHLESGGELQRQGEAIAVAGDLRPSTERIMEAVCRAAESRGYRAVNCGNIPSPAVASFGLEEGIPSIMVTGSHIPDDRNGIKFNKASGEILKSDEAGIAHQLVELDDSLFHASGSFLKPAGASGAVQATAGLRYIDRYLNFFGRDALRGLRVGVYQHSAVGRDGLLKIIAGLGAEAVALGRSDQFIPVDTEAIRDEDRVLAQRWARQRRFDAIVSTDGDSDRPLISDEQGVWLRGDVVGILCAKYLESDSVCVPVSCNTAVEKCGWFKNVQRTRIGSPYVIEAMLQASAAGAQRVVGYEANGGFLLNSRFALGDRELRALPTRDAVIAILGVLLLARQQGGNFSTPRQPARALHRERSLAEFPRRKKSRDSGPVQLRLRGSGSGRHRRRLPSPGPHRHEHQSYGWVAYHVRQPRGYPSPRFWKRPGTPLLHRSRNCRTCRRAEPEGAPTSAEALALHPV